MVNDDIEEIGGSHTALENTTGDGEAVEVHGVDVDAVQRKA